MFTGPARSLHSQHPVLAGRCRAPGRGLQLGGTACEVRWTFTQEGAGRLPAVRCKAGNRSTHRCFVRWTGTWPALQLQSPYSLRQNLGRSSLATTEVSAHQRTHLTEQIDLKHLQRT